jgi:hypothetical protein
VCARAVFIEMKSILSFMESPRAKPNTARPTVAGVGASLKAIGAFKKMGEQARSRKAMGAAVSTVVSSALPPPPPSVAMGARVVAPLKMTQSTTAARTSSVADASAMSQLLGSI